MYVFSVKKSCQASPVIPVEDDFKTSLYLLVLTQPVNHDVNETTVVLAPTNFHKPTCTRHKTIVRILRHVFMEEWMVFKQI